VPFVSSYRYPVLVDGTDEVVELPETDDLLLREDAIVG